MKTRFVITWITLLLLFGIAMVCFILGEKDSITTIVNGMVGVSVAYITGDTLRKSGNELGVKIKKE